MPDAWTEKFDRLYGGSTSDPGVPPEADPWVKRFDKLYGDAASGTKKAAKAGLKFAGDVIGPPARFLGSILEAPVALTAKYGLDTGVPYKFSPSAGMEQFESPKGLDFLKMIAGPLPPFTPAAADVAANLAMTGPMNMVGKAALMPLARAGLEPLRDLPIIKSALEFSKTGASLPAKYRVAAQDLMRSAEGQADLSAYLREKLVSPVLKMSPADQAKLRTAIETRDFSAVPEQKPLADALIGEWENQVNDRLAAGLKPYEIRSEPLKGPKEKITAALAEQLLGKERAAAYGKALAYLDSPAADIYRNRDKTAKASAFVADIESRIRPETMKRLQESRIPFSPTTEWSVGPPPTAYAGGRVGTTASRAEMNPRLRFVTQPSRLKTGMMGRIAEENLNLTTEQVARKISSAVPKIAPENVFEPLGRATMLSGEKHDIRLMNARIIKGLVDKFGEPGSKYENVARHFGVKTGFSPGMQARLETTKLPPQLDEFVANLNKRTQPEEFGRIQRASQWLNQGFKKWALFSPGYTSRNLQNNLFQIVVNEDIGPKEIAGLPKIMARLAKPDEAKTQEWIKMGVSGRGQTAREIGKGGGITGAARAVNTQVEDKSRQLLYELRLLKGDSPAKAARRVDDLLFNYSQRFASPARRKIGQQAIPFVNWSAMVPGLTARTFLERPGSVGFLSNARDRQNRSLGYDDERLAKEFGPWNLPQGIVATGQGKGFVPQFAGQYSVNDWVPTGLTSALDKLLSKVYPTIGVPAQLGVGREAFKSLPLQYDTKTGKKDRFTTGPSSLRAIFKLPGGPKFAADLGITIDPKTKKVIAPARLVVALSAFPQQRIANIVADYIAGVKGKEATALSFGTGVRKVEKYEAPVRPGASR